ncbi:MAG TPA: hypothetical protein ENJ00_04825 [Phycisphaerales bacterium]|nr:hypothetical protein [Phycisphaerales bacterium]
MKRTYTNFAAGFENFMADAIIHFYRRGQLDKAEEYRKRLQSWPGRNTNDWEATEKLSRPLDEYVTLEMKGRYTSPTLYVNQVTAALQGAFVSGLLAGDQDLFREQFEWARKFHAYFMKEQNRNLLANPGIGRMEVMPSDFRVLAGQVFANLLSSMSMEERETLYLEAPNELRLYAYLILKREISERMNRDAAEGKGRPFDEVFPRPIGLDEFIADMQRQREAKQQDFKVDVK